MNSFDNICCSKRAKPWQAWKCVVNKKQDGSEFASKFDLSLSLTVLFTETQDDHVLSFAFESWLLKEKETPFEMLSSLFPKNKMQKKNKNFNNLPFLVTFKQKADKYLKYLEPKTSHSTCFSFTFAYLFANL